jgi:hypothetical protein
MFITPLTHETLDALLAAATPPCISLYQPTHRRHPENQQDPIRYRNLVNEIEQVLQKQHPVDVVSALIEPFAQLGCEPDFWNHALDGLAVFGAPGLFQVFAMPRTVQELAVVADSFHTKPLRRFLQSTDRYHLLALSLHGVSLFEGTRDGLQAIELASGVPSSIGEALGEELTEPHQTVASYGGSSGGSTGVTGRMGGGSVSPMHHGHGGKRDEVDKDADRFFRAIDRAILEHHSRPSGLPLILAALPEHHSLFHQVSHNPFLLAEGVKINPEALPLGELSARAWQVFEPQHQARVEALVGEFGMAESQGFGFDDLTRIGEAAAAGRIATLLIEADRKLAGHIHPGSGAVHFSDDETEQAEGEDLLDDLGEAVLKMGGRVFVVTAAQMPTTTGAAATCRF